MFVRHGFVAVGPKFCKFSTVATLGSSPYYFSTHLRSTIKEDENKLLMVLRFMDRLSA